MLQESLIYRLVYSIYSYIARISHDSVIITTLKKWGSSLRRIFSGSALIDITTREGAVNNAYETSVLYKAVDGLMNLPQRLLHPQYKKAEKVFAESRLFKVILFLADRIHLLAAAFVFIALIVPYDLWDNRYSMAAMILLVLLFFIRSVVEGRTGFRTAVINVYFILFMVSVLLALILSIMPSSSLRFLAFYLTCFMMVLVLVASVRTEKEITQALSLIAAGLTIAGLYGVYQYVTGVPVNPAWVDTKLNQGDMSRAYSFFNNPNDFAEVILVFSPFYFALMLNAKKLAGKALYLMMAAPPLLAMLLTKTRGAWVAIALAAAVYVFFQNKKLIPLFILLGAAAVPLLPNSILLRLRTFNFYDSSITTRLDIWKTVLPILKDYWFTGLGLGHETLLRVSKNYYIFVSKGAIPSHSHNLFLQLWLETGFPGIAAFIGLMLTTVKRVIRTAAHSANKAIRNILIAGLASLAGMLANGMIEYIWFDRRVMLFFWTSVGLILAALNISHGADAAPGMQEQPEQTGRDAA